MIEQRVTGVQVEEGRTVDYTAWSLLTLATKGPAHTITSKAEEANPEEEHFQSSQSSSVDALARV